MLNIRLTVYPDIVHLISILCQVLLLSVMPFNGSHHIIASGWVTKRQPLPGDSSPGYIVRLAWQGREIQNA